MSSYILRRNVANPLPQGLSRVMCKSSLLGLLWGFALGIQERRMRRIRETSSGFHMAFRSVTIHKGTRRGWNSDSFFQLWMVSLK